MSDRMRAEADRWFYDLGKLAEVVECNDKRSIAAHKKAEAAQHKTDMARRRLWVLAGFVLFAFVLLAWRNEVAADRISRSNDRITMTQDATCASGLAISQNFNRQQDALIAIERANPFINDEVRAARIEAYEAARIDPLPICSTR